MAETITLQVLTNVDDVYLVWHPSGFIQDCRGFAIQRKLTRAGFKKTEISYLPNRVGFASDSPKPGEFKPSNVWPFQRLSWTDHDANTGDTVSYQIVAMVGPNADHLSEGDASEWSEPVKLTPDCGDNTSAYFNRGFVMSQFMARYFNGEITEQKLKVFKTELAGDSVSSPEKDIKTFLGGDLRSEMLGCLEQVYSDPKLELYAALYELSDPGLLAGLLKIGKRAHIILANGSNAHGDENAHSREMLDGHCDVYNRMVPKGINAHNKFFVVANKAKPADNYVYTGSTNWTPTGLCTQVNNLICIKDPQVASAYLKQWDLLKQSGDGFPPTLVNSNDSPKQIGKNVTVCFSRTKKAVDINTIVDVVNAAKQGILFLMFMPGGKGVLPAVLNRQKQVYVHGVVSTLPAGVDENQHKVPASVSLYKAGTKKTHDYTAITPIVDQDVVTPQGIAHGFSYWTEEVTRKLFLSQIGFAIIHSKVIVTDPFGTQPTVITGSNNFSLNGSARNDENIIIIRNNARLAQAYATNIVAVYDHYRWRMQLAKGKTAFKGLEDNDKWLQQQLSNDVQEWNFWKG